MASLPPFTSPANIMALSLKTEMGRLVSLSSTTKKRKVGGRRVVGIDGGAAVEPEVSWQIAVGAAAGVTPFIVAGIEFSKRIVAQRECGVCSGTGLVKREKYYFRCPKCGGFLPWQSWRRFFTG